MTTQQTEPETTEPTAVVDPLALALRSLEEARRIAAPVDEAIRTGDMDLVGDARRQAAASGASIRQAQRIDDAAKLAVVSIAQDLRALRDAVPQILATQAEIAKAVVPLLTGAAKDMQRTADHLTGTGHDGEPKGE